MKIETAGGFRKEGVSKEELVSKLGELNGDNDFLILSDQNLYIQCALSGEGFTAEYQDTEGHFSSDSELSADTIEKMFSLYLAGDGTWKGLTGWNPEGVSTQTGAAGGGGGITGDQMPNFSPGNILNSVKKQVEREVSRSISRKTSGMIGKLSGSFSAEGAGCFD